MTRWLKAASPVERARELLRELDSDEGGEWSAWSWEAQLQGAPDRIVDAARDVAHGVEKAQRALRRFVAEIERPPRVLESESSLRDDVRLSDDGCGLYPPED